MKIKELDNNNRVEIDLEGKRVRTPYLTNDVVKLSNDLIIKVLSYSNGILVGKKLQPCIYVWTTKSYSKTNTYKVGLVNWQSVETRIKQTDRTGVLEKIELVGEFPLSVYDPKVTEQIENEIHTRIGLSRIDKSREAVQADYKQIIEPTILQVIEEFKSKKIIDIECPTPRYFQKDATEIAKSYYITNNRGSIHWTCASGKSSGSYFIWDGIRTIYDNERNLVVILVPNRQLVVQTHDDWRDNVTGHGKLFKSMKIGDVEGSKNDVAELSRWIDSLTKRTTNLLISTYQSSHLVGKALNMSGVSADFLIYDEAHRLTGEDSKVWKQCLYDSKFPAKKRLAMTASPVEYSTTSIGFSGMENEEMFGKKFHIYSFLDAQFDGYIAPLELKGISLPDDIREYYETFMKKNEKIINKDMLKYNFDDADELDDITLDEGNIIFFSQLHNTLLALQNGEIAHPLIYANSSSRIKRFMSALLAMAPEYGVKIDYHNIFGHKDKSIEGRINELNTKFANSKIGVVGNVYCLQEGISVKQIDSVVLVDPRSSAPSIIQIIGRPVRLNGTDKVAKVYLPIIVKEDGGKLVLDKDYFERSTSWMVSIAAADEDLHNMILNGIDVTSKSREGIEIRDIKNKRKRGSISSTNRNLRPSVTLSDVDFGDYKTKVKFKTIISTETTVNKVKSTESGMNDYLNRHAKSFILKYKDKLDTSIDNFNIKSLNRYDSMINTEVGYIEEFNMMYNVTNEVSESILKTNGLDEVIQLSKILQEKSIGATFQLI
jgi:superfamily II DNA or RNA helicase